MPGGNRDRRGRLGGGGGGGAPGQQGGGKSDIKNQIKNLPFEDQQAVLAGADAPAAKVPLIPVGTFGMVTKPVELTTKEGKVALAAGDAVEVVKATETTLQVKAFSGKGGALGEIPVELFKAQPRLDPKDDQSGPMDYTYKEYVGELFIGKKNAAGQETREPRIEDVDQGSLGDCYLIAAMGAVVAQRPDIIQNMIAYDASSKTFKVTFQELQADRTFKPHVEVVDAYLPTRQGGGPARTAYAQSDTAFDPKNQALWPAIIEKAYAQWKGGFDKIEGGSAGKAMEAITGVRSVSQAMPSEKDVIGLFEQWQKDQKAVACGTKDFIQQGRKAGMFSGSGVGPYTATLTDVNGQPTTPMKNSVSVTDKGGTAGSAMDDGKGKMQGSKVQAGTIGYDTGAVSLTYKDKSNPAAAADLETSYRYEGTLSSALNLHGDHAYMFREVKDGLLYFQNPWGPAASKHPKGISAKDFVAYFETIGVNAPVPQQKDK